MIGVPLDIPLNHIILLTLQFLGYCRGGVQDGSFGSPTNPKAGGEQSDWIKQNAKSDRNEEYYGKIEDDNRKAHVKFRKENPIFYEQIPVLLPRLEKIEKNVYEPCTYCNYDPKEDKEYQDLVKRLDGNQNSSNRQQNRRKNGQNTRKNGQNRRQNGQNRRQNGQNGRKNGQKSSNSCQDECSKVCPTSPKRVQDACVKGCAKRC